MFYSSERSKQMTHLNALQVRLSHERDYLAKAKTQKEIELRTVWIAQIEKEIANEYKFLGLEPAAEIEMSDDELLAALSE
jgi:hypothetical protein